MVLGIRFSHPLTQVVLISMICFTCPGFFNALNGMGAAGRTSSVVWVTNDANTALSVTFTVSSLIGGGVYNILGNWIIIPGALTYVLYVGSYLSTSYGFTIAAGAILGIGAGFLWATQGAIMMSYPLEQNKGKYFAIFWMIFNVGAVIGSAVSLGVLFNTGNQNQVPIAVYIVFMIIMACGAGMGFFLLNPKKVHHADGTPVSLHKYSSVTRETREILKLFLNWKMLILIPLFGGSNWFYTYQQSDYQAGGFFNIRARSLNNLMYWLFQIVGAGLYGLFLDWTWLGSRKRRAWVGWALNGVLLSAVFIGSIFVQEKFTRNEFSTPPVDVSTPGYGGYMVTYMLFGAVDSIYQGYCYWLMGALTNDTEKASRYAGFYKTIQNAFAAIAPQVDNAGIPFLGSLLLAWLLCVFGLILAIPVVYTVTDVTEEVVGNLEGVEDEEKVVGGVVEGLGQGQDDKEMATYTEA
ncbi:hypothetical protein BZG36_01035 [Bifiguratus adelaidae]|uniref:Major facilitator superfamily (MFS) profile domain-containing protein n=1 Tax=Bifiguratus adelaidae TaxID=1938954 RepID=A0A261Y673_9FUNG|nr:hypothetical protein BZG36_01035 [Bifiguratus adelaidae]